MKKVYAVVVTYNGKQWLDRCLGSLQRSHTPVHTIVVDNASIDGTPDYIEKNFPQVELIRANQNLGFGKGNNIGLKKVLSEHADFVLLLNQDAWIKENTLEKLIQVQVRNSQYGIISPIHLTETGQKIETKFAEYAGPQNTPGLLSDLFLASLGEVYPTKFVNAACWLISRECLEKVGGFNPIFRHYGEDEDFVNRCRFWSFQVAIVPDAVVYHGGIFSWSKIEFDLDRNVIFNLITLSNINHRYRSSILLFIKKSVDEITSLLLFRKFKKLRIRFLAFIKTTTQLRTVYSSRRQATMPCAFLSSDG